jgi:hypothetical protein
MRDKDKGRQKDGVTAVCVDEVVSEFSVLELSKCGKPFAVISSKGELEKFDNVLCREAAKEFDEAGLGVKEEYQCWAKLIVLILDVAGSEVDHIVKAGGGTQGDLIRAVSR